MGSSPPNVRETSGEPPSLEPLPRSEETSKTSKTSKTSETSMSLRLDRFDANPFAAVDVVFPGFYDLEPGLPQLPLRVCLDKPAPERLRALLHATQCGRQLRC